MGSTVGHVTELWRYPVKSLGGETVEQVALGPLGVPGDRRWALRNLDTGKIVSAKLPKLGHETLALEAGLDDATGTIVVRVTETGEELGEVGDAELDAALSERLGVPVRLEPATDADEVYESWWPEIEGLALAGEIDLPTSLATQKGTFVDLAALHLLTTASLQRLADLLPESTIATRRFRPSLVVAPTGAAVGDGDSDDGWAENAWRERTATLGGARLAIGSATPRCVMTTLEQPGLPADRAVLQTLATENRVTQPGMGDFACLGIYAEVVEPGPVQVGDPLVLDAPG